MKPRKILATLVACLALGSAARAADIIKANNTTSLNQAGSWVSGGPPGVSDVGVWDATVTSATNYTLGTPPPVVSWAGMRVANPGLAPSIRNTSGLSLTLGSAGIDMSAATQNFTVGPNITAGANQIWNIAAGKTLACGNGVVGTGTITKSGAGTLLFTGLAIHSANINLGAGTLQSSPASGTQTISGIISGSGGFLLKDTAGALSLSGANTFGGGITLSAGQLNLNHAGALGAATLTIGGGSLDNTSGGALTLTGNNPLNWNADFTFTGTSNLNLGPAVVTVSGDRTLTVTANTLAVGGPVSGTASLTKAGNGTFEIGTGASVTLAGQGRPNGGSWKITGGSFTCSGIAFGGSTGAFDLEGGTLVTNSITRSGAAGTFNFNGGTLRPGAGGSAFLSGLTAANVRAGGALIDTNGLSVTIAQPLAHDAALGTTPDGGLFLTGGGTLTLTGASTYTGTTTVSYGTLALGAGGSLANSPVIDLLFTGSLDAMTGATLPAGQTLKGTGTIYGNLTIGAGATLAPGETTLGTLVGYNSLTLAGNANFRIDKTGGSLTCDAVTGLTTLTYGGTLNASATGDALAVGDTFQLFTAGTYAGRFATFNLPALPAGLFWETSTLNTDGTITVVDTVPVPGFSLSPGVYLGAQAVTISSVGGSTIHYTTDGSDPTISATALSGPSPIVGVVVPNDTAAFTINAYATEAGATPSAVATAVYNTLSAPTWTYGASGDWTEPLNWLYGFIASGSGMTADFSTLTMSGDITVSQIGARTIGYLKFGDVGNQYNWSLVGSTVTLDAGAAQPAITVNNRATSISAPLTATNGFTKNGAGMLTLAGPSMTFSGATTLAAGVLELKNNGNGSGNGYRSPITSNGGTAVWLTADSGQTSDLRANIAGSASVVKKGDGIVRVGTFSGVPTLNYSGATTIEAGSLNLQGQAAGRGFDTTGPLVVSPGAFFDMSGLAAQTSANAARFGALTGLGTIRGDYGNAFLECGNGGGSGTFDGTIANASASTSLIKSGTGTQVFSAANTYNGTTTISGGTLLITNASGSATGTSSITVNSGCVFGGTGKSTGDITISAGGSIAPGSGGAGTLATGNTILAGTYSCELDGASCDKLAVAGNLTISGATLAISTLAGGATQGSYVIATYTGTLTGTFATVTGLPSGYTVNYATANQIKLAGLAGFTSWVAGYSLTGSNALPGADPDHDGVPNAVEYVLGGNPAAVADNSLLPTISPVTANVGNGMLNYLKFTYRRSKASADGLATASCEYNTGLSGSWTAASNGVNGVVVQTTANGFGSSPQVDKVDVYLPRTLAAGGKLFGRLRVNIP